MKFEQPQSHHTLKKKKQIESVGHCIILSSVLINVDNLLLYLVSHKENKELYELDTK